MARQIVNCEFHATVKGEERVLRGTGAGSFEASRDAINKTMRKEKISYNEIKISKTITEKPTGKWV
ncbi:hypothetical protein ACJ7K1_27845 [Paenibacillus elgii]